MARLTPKQKRFVEEYCVDMNATQAAIRAEYSKRTAYSIGQENLKKPEIKAAIDKALQDIRDVTLANAYEVEKYLTSVMRGESQAEIVVIEGTGEGMSAARRMDKAPDEKERLKAAEILAKRHGLTDTKLQLTHQLIPPTFAGENDLE